MGPRTKALGGGCRLCSRPGRRPGAPERRATGRLALLAVGCLLLGACLRLGIDPFPNKQDGGGDSGVPDSGPPDGDTPDVGPPDGDTPDVGPPDSDTPDVGPPDGDTPDVGPPDGDTPDVGPPDGDTPDVGPPDGDLPDDGLVAAWSFDELIGQDVFDSTGHGYDGVLGQSDGAEPEDPRRVTTAELVCTGGALAFDGADDVVTVPVPSAASLSAFTITFSMVVTGRGEGDLARILTKENGDHPDVIVHFRAGDDAIAINMFDTTDRLYATFAGHVVYDLRSSFAVVYDDEGDRLVHVFQDGVEASYLRQDAMEGTFRTTTNTWRIGNELGGVRAFDGVLDEMRVYDRALSPAEIAAIAAYCSAEP
jgi:hypothetical protein